MSTSADYLTADLQFAAPDWSLEKAAAAMVRGGFRHLVVVDGGELDRRALDAGHRPLLDRRWRHLDAGRAERLVERIGMAGGIGPPPPSATDQR